MDLAIPQTIDEWNAAGRNYLPGHLGLEFLSVEPGEVIATLQASKTLSAWNGFLHAGSIVSLADTCCGYGTVKNLRAGASGFTTVELKSNFLATVRTGTVRCVATPLHLGRSTHVWDATVTAGASDKTLAHFRCTQLILWPKTS